MYGSLCVMLACARFILPYVIVVVYYLKRLPFTLLYILSCMCAKLMFSVRYSEQGKQKAPHLRDILTIDSNRQPAFQVVLDGLRPQALSFHL